MSGKFPSTFEVGTHNLLGIVGMTAGVRWIKQAGLDSIRMHEQSLTQRFMDGVADIPGLKIFGNPSVERRTAVVSLTRQDVDPQYMARWLASEHNVASRAGYHCAPLAHESIGSLPGLGTLRVSFGFSNTVEEVDSVAGMIREMPINASIPSLQSDYSI